MLKIRLKKDGSIAIGADITIQLLSTSAGQATLGIKAPESFNIYPAKEASMQQIKEANMQQIVEVRFEHPKWAASKIEVKYPDEDVWVALFEYYSDEIQFSEEELMGKTAAEASKLRFEKDLAYIRS